MTASHWLCVVVSPLAGLLLCEENNLPPANIGKVSFVLFGNRRYSSCWNL